MALVNQETYDEVVEENVREFDMSKEEAVEEAVKQFQAQASPARLRPPFLPLFVSNLGGRPEQHREEPLSPTPQRHKARCRSRGAAKRAGQSVRSVAFGRMPGAAGSASDGVRFESGPPSLGR